MWRGGCEEGGDGSTNPGCPPATLAASRIGGLRSDIIPKREFPLRRWFYANPLWYYHAPGAFRAPRIDRRFYRLVDPALRDLCRILHAAGIRTTPSCQGHFYGRLRFEQIWEELVREAGLIRATGLIVRDSETDQPFRFEDPHYRLPWDDFSSFYDAAARHQTSGYLGLIVPSILTKLATRLAIDPHESEFVRIRCDRELSNLFGNPTFGITVNAPIPEQRDAAWRDLTQYISRIL